MARKKKTRIRVDAQRWADNPFGKIGDQPLPFSVPEAFVITISLDEFNALSRKNQRAYMKGHALWLIKENAGKKAWRTMRNAGYDDILTAATGSTSPEIAEEMLNKYYLAESVARGERSPRDAV